MIIYNNFDLTDFNGYKLKSICSKAFFPENENDIIDFFSTVKDYIIIGSGHNIILSKEYYDTTFFIFNKTFQTAEVNSDKFQIKAKSSYWMPDLAKLALDHNFSGLEMFYDIPSSLGGAVFMNAGANNEEIKDLVISSRYFDLNDLEIKEINNKEHYFTYRNSIFQNDNSKIILESTLQLVPEKRHVIKEKMEIIKNNRAAKQPKEFPSCGSVFKRPLNKYVGPMIDQLNLKGKTIGGAQVSIKHSGFIINKGNATGKDILDLINFIKEEVYRNFKIELSIEQKII